MKNFRASILGALTIFIVSNVPSAQAYVRSNGYIMIPVHGFDVYPLRFRLSQVTLFQSSGASFSGNLNWSPSFYLTDLFSFRPNFGLGPRFANGKSFMSYEFNLGVAYEFYHSLSAEVGVGLQAWSIPTNGPLPAGYFNLVHELSSGTERQMLHAIYLGYSPIYYDSGDKLISEIRAGVEFAF